MRIGEVAEAAGITTKTIRFYEDRGLLPPAERKQRANAMDSQALLHRSTDCLQRVERVVRVLRDEGLAIHGVGTAAERKQRAIELLGRLARLADLTLFHHHDAVGAIA